MIPDKLSTIILIPHPLPPLSAPPSSASPSSGNSSYGRLASVSAPFPHDARTHTQSKRSAATIKNLYFIRKKSPNIQARRKSYPARPFFLLVLFILVCQSVGSVKLNCCVRILYKIKICVVHYHSVSEAVHFLPSALFICVLDSPSPHYLFRIIKCLIQLGILGGIRRIVVSSDLTCEISVNCLFSKERSERG